MLLDLNNVEVEQRDFEPIPAGKYVLQVADAEVRETKSGTGEYIWAELEVVGSDFEGRKIFTNFNIKNDNEKAVEIGMQQLKSMMLAAGKKDCALKNASDLCGLRALAKVKVRKDETWGDRNEVHYWIIPEAGSEVPGVGVDESEKIPF